jgi:hypothetical protein
VAIRPVDKVVWVFPNTVYAVPGDEAGAPMIISFLESPFTSLRVATAVPNWLESVLEIATTEGLFERAMSLYPDRNGMNTRLSTKINSACTGVHDLWKIRALLIFVWSIGRVILILSAFAHELARALLERASRAARLQSGGARKSENLLQHDRSRASATGSGHP